MPIFQSNVTERLFFFDKISIDQLCVGCLKVALHLTEKLVKKSKVVACSHFSFKLFQGTKKLSTGAMIYVHQKRILKCSEMQTVSLTLFVFLFFWGANVHTTDPSRGLTSWEWACYTGRSDSAFIMQRLMDRPCPEQFCDQYKPEWPKMKELLAKAAEPKTCLQRISECVRSVVSFRAFHGPEEDGVLDHMVKMTTSLGSPFIALSCRTVCPGSPPSVGKRRLAVQEILRKQRAEEIRSQDKDHVSSYEKLFQNSKITVIPKKKDRRASLQPVSLAVSQVSTIATRKTSLLPLHLLRRSSVRPGFVIPKVRVSKAPPPTFQPEKARRRSSAKDDPYLQIPKWRYKELKEERKKAEEQEKKRVAEAQRQRQVSPARSRTWLTGSYLEGFRAISLVIWAR